MGVAVVVPVVGGRVVGVPPVVPEPVPPPVQDTKVVTNKQRSKSKSPNLVNVFFIVVFLSYEYFSICKK